MSDTEFLAWIRGHCAVLYWPDREGAYAVEHNQYRGWDRWDALRQLAHPTTIIMPLDPDVPPDCVPIA